MTDFTIAAARPFRLPRAKAIGAFPAIVLLLCASLLAALEVPSKPFLEKNSFYLSSAGFRVQVANDPAAKKAMHALPPHRFVIHRYGNDVRYLYAEPNHCVCVFIGTQANYQDYRAILTQSMQPDNNVAPDYKTQASALLTGNEPLGIDTIGDNTIAPYYQAYY
jgi:hypothetical protein